MPPTDELLTVEQVAAELGLNQQTVRNWINRGELTGLRIGHRRVRIQRSELDRFTGARKPSSSSGQPVPAPRSEPNWSSVADGLDRIAEDIRDLAKTIRSRPSPRE